MDMGLSIVDVQPRFISAKKGDREFTFTLMVKDYYKDGDEYFVDVDKTETDFIVFVFRNKPNDNVVLFKTDEIGDGKLSLLDMTDKIKKKWRWEINQISTT